MSWELCDYSILKPWKGKKKDQIKTEAGGGEADAVVIRCFIGRAGEPAIGIQDLNQAHLLPGDK